MGEDQSIYLSALAWQVVNQFQSCHVERDEAFQVAFTSGLQAIRSAEQRNETPAKRFLLLWMKQSLMRFSRWQRYETQRESSDAHLPFQDEKSDDYLLPRDIETEDASEAQLEARDFIAARIHLLTEKQREAIRLVFYEGKSMSEAAKQIGVNRDAVSKRIIAATKKLKGDE